MLSFTYTLTGTKKSIAELIDSERPNDFVFYASQTNSSFRGNIILQAPVANGADINFGESVSQDGYISPGGTVTLERVSLHDVYVNGNDDIIVLLFT